MRVTQSKFTKAKPKNSSNGGGGGPGYRAGTAPPGFLNSLICHRVRVQQYFKADANYRESR